MTETLRTIKVKSLDDVQLEYRVSLSARIEQLRNEIGRDCGIEAANVRLIYHAHALRDEQIIGETFHSDGEIIYLVACIRSQTPPIIAPSFEPQPIPIVVPPPLPFAFDFSGIMNSVTQFVFGVTGEEPIPAEGPIPAPPNQTSNVSFRPRSSAPNQLTNVRRDAFTISLETIDGEAPTQHTFSTGALRVLDGLSTRIANLRPQVPRRADQNTSAGILADFLQTLHNSLETFLPQLARAQALLANEAYITDPEQRQRAGLLVRAVARYFHVLRGVSEPLLALDHFDFGPVPGAYGLRRAPPSAHSPFGNERAAPRRPPSTRSAEPPTAPTGSEGEREVREREREAEHRERDRREAGRLIEVLQEGVQLGTGMGQILSRVSETPQAENDITTILTRHLTLLDVMNIFNDQTPLDRCHSLIAADFRALIVVCENRPERLREALFDHTTMALRGIIRENAAFLAPDFDFAAAIDAVNLEFVERFREVILREYASDAPPFSAALALTMKLYFGRLAFELSIPAVEGIETVQMLFCEAFRQQAADFGLNDQATALFDTIWPRIHEGYLINRSLHRERTSEGALRARMAAARALDAQLPEQPPLSAAYLAGRLQTP